MKVLFTRSVNAPVEGGVAKKGNVYDLEEGLAQDLIGQGSCEISRADVIPFISVPVITQGGPIHNHKIGLVFPDGWKGSFTFSVLGAKSDPISYPSSPGGIQSTIEGIGAVGKGNVSVIKEDDTLTVLFQNDLGARAITGISADIIPPKVETKDEPKKEK